MKERVCGNGENDERKIGGVSRGTTVGRILSSQKNARGFSDERNLSFPLSLSHPWLTHLFLITGGVPKMRNGPVSWIYKRKMYQVNSQRRRASQPVSQLASIPEKRFHDANHPCGPPAIGNFFLIKRKVD
jgi:hypothetical protein